MTEPANHESNYPGTDYFRTRWTDSAEKIQRLRTDGDRQYRRLASPWWRTWRIARRCLLFAGIPGAFTFVAAFVMQSLFGDTENYLALGVSALAGALAMFFGMALAANICERMDRR